MTHKSSKQRQPICYCIRVFAVTRVTNSSVAISQFFLHCVVCTKRRFLDLLTEFRNGSRPKFLESVLLRCRGLCDGHIDYRIASAGVNTLPPTRSLPFKTTGQHSASRVKSIASSSANGLTQRHQQRRVPTRVYWASGPGLKGLGLFLTIMYILFSVQWIVKALGSCDQQDVPTGSGTYTKP